MKEINKFFDTISELAIRYCGEEIVKDFRRLVTQASNFESELLIKSKKDQVPSTFVSEEVEINLFSDKILSLCKNRLKQNQYFDFLLEFAEICLLFGEFRISESILNQLLVFISENPKFSLLNSQALLLRAELYIRSSRWLAAQRDLRTVKKLQEKKSSNLIFGKIYNMYGIIETEKGNLSQATKFYQKALEYSLKSNEKALVGVLEMNLGIIYTIRSLWDEAFAHYKRALASFEKLMDLKRLALVRHNLGLLFRNRGELEAALTEFDRSLEYAIEANYYLAKGLAYLGKGDVYAKLEEYAIAIEYCNKAMEVFYKIMDKVGLADTYKIKGVIQRDISNLEIAETYLLTSLRLSEEIESMLNFAETSYELGILYRKWNKPELAIKYLKLSKSYFTKIGAKENLERVKIIMDRTSNS